MALSNAERQKRFRERRSTIVKSVEAYRGRSVSMEDSPKVAAEITLSTLVALIQSGECEMESSFNSDDRALLTIRADTSAILPEVKLALQQSPFCDWVSEAVETLWHEGHPVEFRVSVTAVVDKRKLSRMEKRLAKEGEEEA